METYILKRPIYNQIDFPIGTIVKINDPNWEVEVVEGELKGKKGHIADGVERFIIDDTEENRALIQQYIEHDENLMKQLIQNRDRIENIPNSVL
jgi:hypothetical protein